MRIHFLLKKYTARLIVEDVNVECRQLTDIYLYLTFIFKESCYILGNTHICFLVRI